MLCHLIPTTNFISFLRFQLVMSTQSPRWSQDIKLVFELRRRSDNKKEADDNEYSYFMEIISNSSLDCVLLLFKWFSFLRLHIRQGLNWLRVKNRFMCDLKSSVIISISSEKRGASVLVIVLKFSNDTHLRNVQSEIFQFLAHLKATRLPHQFHRSNCLFCCSNQFAGCSSDLTSHMQIQTQNSFCELRTDCFIYGSLLLSYF